MRKKFLIFAVAFVTLLAAAFEFYPRSSQAIDLSTGSGLSKMLRYDDAQVYLFGEVHRKVEYQQFRNVLFKYLVKEKGVRVFVEESGYATAFLCNETVQGRLLFSDWLDRCIVSQEDYELFQWITDWNSNKEDTDKISIIGIDITDDIGNIQTLCQYLLKNHNLGIANAETQLLLTSIQELNPFGALALHSFQNELLPQLIKLYQTSPEQLKSVLGEQTVPLERTLLGWEQAQERLRLKGEVEQLGGPDDMYRENCLYEHFMWEYEQNPNSKYYGQFGGAHVLRSDYSGKIYRVRNSFVTRLSSSDSPLHGSLTVIDGGLSLEIGSLGNSNTNKAILYNTALADPPFENSNKFYFASLDIPDTDFAQYVLLFEDSANLTVTKELSGAYWKYH